MTIISEKTGKNYDSVEACLADEKKYDEEQAKAKEKREKLANTRKERAAEVEEAYRAILKAQKTYREKLNQFVEDYGSFHMTIRTGEANPFNFLDRLFDWF